MNEDPKDEEAKNSLYEPTYYLRRDMDDKQSDITLQSALNQFQSYNTSFNVATDPLSNRTSQNILEDEDSPFKVAKDIEEIEIQVQICNEDQIQNKEWQLHIKEAKDFMNQNEKLRLDNKKK